MFPNMRLMIAAIAASIVMLSCGFGVFAAFRINHDPFGRLPNAAPLQLGAEAMTSSVVTLAAGPTFGARLAQSETRSAGAASPSPVPDRGGEIDATNSAAAAAPAADADEPPPAIPTVAIAQQPIAPLPDADMAAGTPTDTPADLPTGTTPDAKPDAVAAAPEAPAAAAPDAAAAERPADQTAPVKQATVEPAAEPQAADEIQMPDKAPQSESTDKTENAAVKHAAKSRRIAARKTVANKTVANKILGKQRVAAVSPAHRARRFRVRTVVQTNPETSGFEQSGLQAAPATPVRLTRLHRTARTGGVGGPFVRPPAH